MTILRFSDAETIQSAGAFMQGELERLDKKLYEPKSKFTWGRDIDLMTFLSATKQPPLSLPAMAPFPGSLPAISLGPRTRRPQLPRCL